MAERSSKAEKERAFKAVQDIIDQYVQLTKNLERPLFDYQVMRDCKLLDATPDGRTVFELRITDEYSNLNGA
ncbi:hypothetical protein MMC08_003776 [Hypocenomyce scalaris]|nr:hypothetical protein [Hypocenomyce scalaris]